MKQTTQTEVTSLTGNFEVFKECGQSVNNENILSLTHEIMEKSGYKRVGGKNIYEKPLDNCLVAKWVYLCRDIIACHIIGCSKYTEAYLSDVISFVVKDFFENADACMLSDERVLYSYLKTLICWRARKCNIYERRRLGTVHLYRKSKEDRTQYYKFTNKLVSIDGLDPYLSDEGDEEENCLSIIDEVRDLLKDDNFTLMFFDGILRSKFTVNLKKSNDYVCIPKESQNDEMKQKVADAFNRIRDTSSYVLGRKFSKKKITAKSIAFNGDGKYL